MDSAPGSKVAISPGIGSAGVRILLLLQIQPHLPQRGTSGARPLRRVVTYSLSRR
jgi:hypothetical protein